MDRVKNKKVSPLSQTILNESANSKKDAPPEVPQQPPIIEKLKKIQSEEMYVSWYTFENNFVHSES